MTNNANNFTNPISVNTGGTGISSTTAYGVLCGGTSITNPIQSVSGLGTSGQVLTSQGSGSLPIWSSAPSGNGNLVYINTYNWEYNSGNPGINITGFSNTYNTYQIIYYVSATGTYSQNIGMQLTGSGGSSYTSSGNYWINNTEGAYYVTGVTDRLLLASSYSVSATTASVEIIQWIFNVSNGNYVSSVAWVLAPYPSIGSLYYGGFSTGQSNFYNVTSGFTVLNSLSSTATAVLYGLIE